jgi:transcriptional regulator GlxA family with amidase domain
MNSVVTLKLSKPASNQRKLKKLCEWIDANIDKPISWADLSEHSGMDHMELQRQFTTYMKSSPMQWIRQRRTESQRITLAQAMPPHSELPARLATPNLQQSSATQ